MERVSDLTGHFQVSEELWAAFIQEVGSPGGGRTSGVGLEAGEAHHVHEGWGPLGRLDGRGPMGSQFELLTFEATYDYIQEGGQGHEGKTLKFTQVLDQGDDGEFEVLNEDDKLLLLQKYINTTGSMPEEEEEPTIEQLSALKKKLSLGKPPYADFGVFVPFGRKALRASK